MPHYVQVIIILASIIVITIIALQRAKDKVKKTVEKHLPKAENSNGSNYRERLNEKISAAIAEAKEKIDESEKENEEIIKKILAGEKLPAGTTIKGSLDLSGKIINHDIFLDGTIIEDDFNASGLTVNGDIYLKGAQIGDIFDLSDATINSLFMKGASTGGDCYLKCLCRGDIIMDGSVEIGGDLDITESELKGNVYFDGIKLSDGNFLAEGININGLISLDNAEISGYLDFENSVVRIFSAKKIRLEGACHMDSIEVLEDFNFTRASVGENNENGEDFEMQGGAKIGGNAFFSGLKTGGSFLAEDVCFQNDADFSEAEIEGSLVLTGSNIYSLNFSETVIKSDLDLNDAQIKKPIIFNQTSVEGDINLEGSNVTPFPGLSVSGSINI